MMMATQMTAPGAPPDMKKAYKEEWEALEVTLLQLDVMKQKQDLSVQLTSLLLDIMKQKQDLSVQNLWNY